MADVKAKSAGDATTQDTTKIKKKRLVPALLVLGMMGVEAAVIIFVMKMFGGDPSIAMAEPAHDDGHAETASDHSGGHGASGDHGSKPAVVGNLVEIPVVELDAYNHVSGRINLYHIQICALVKKEKEASFADLVKSRVNTLQDRVQTLIRSADPQQMSEPGLETLKKQIRFELERTLGADAGIEDLLIPKLLQTRVAI